MSRLLAPPRLPSLCMGLLLIGTLLVLTGCGAEDDVNTVEIASVDNEMRYAQEEFTVQAGEEVRLVFDNTGTTSEAMYHNVVILTTDDQGVADEVGEAGLQAGEEAEYIPDHDAIYTNTPLAAPGESVEITFTAPEEPGTYTFLCTYPGHHTLMRGVMVVEPSEA